MIWFTLRPKSNEGVLGGNIFLAKAESKMFRSKVSWFGSSPWEMQPLKLDVLKIIEMNTQSI